MYEKIKLNNTVSNFIQSFALFFRQNKRARIIQSKYLILSAYICLVRIISVSCLVHTVVGDPTNERVLTRDISIERFLRFIINLRGLRALEPINISQSTVGWFEQTCFSYVYPDKTKKTVGNRTHVIFFCF